MSDDSRPSAELVMLLIKEKQAQSLWPRSLKSTFTHKNIRFFDVAKTEIDTTFDCYGHELSSFYCSTGVPMKLELSSLTMAIASLEKSINSYHVLCKNSSLTINDIDTVKAGVIQNFEVAYEQCWKFMKRWIELNVSADVVDGVSRRELFRVGAENRLLDDVSFWMEFHQSRNLTSHTYNATTAGHAFDSALLFIDAAREFLKRLEERND
jgi:nucleotidyltransferase substrate binding protein (TIGR01987 family)